MDAVPPTTGRMTRSTHIKYIQWHMAISAGGKRKQGRREEALERDGDFRV